MVEARGVGQVWLHAPVTMGIIHGHGGVHPGVVRDIIVVLQRQKHHTTI